MASKLNFRARTLDAAKPMAIYNVEELPELADLNAINRSVPAMPSGMEKEEESEKHLQDILDAQSTQSGVLKTLYIPTPEVFHIPDSLYTKGHKVPRQYIHVQPFSMDAEKPDYDVDDEDQKFIKDILKEEKKFEVNEDTFEDMIDRLEKNSGQSVVSAKEAKLLLKEDDDLILAVYDYWVDKRLRLKQSLMPNVKSDKRDMSTPAVQQNNANPNLQSAAVPGTPMAIPQTPIMGGGAGGGGPPAVPSSGSMMASGVANTNPYIAFRRRTEKMQTRKNRKNDEVSYEKMLKLRRDLSRAIVLLEMVKRREKTKKEDVNLTAEIFEKRYNMGDFDGKMIAELQAKKARAMVLQPHNPIFAANSYAKTWLANQHLMRGVQTAVIAGRHDKKSSKKRKKSGGSSHLMAHLFRGGDYSTPLASDDDSFSGAAMSINSDMEEEEAPFAFRRKANVQYLAPLDPDEETTSSNTSKSDPMTIAQRGEAGSTAWPFDPFHDLPEKRSRYYLGSLSTPRPQFLGLVRRRVGRGGRFVLDRMSSPPPLGDFSSNNEDAHGVGVAGWNQENEPHYRPVTPLDTDENNSRDADNINFPVKPLDVFAASRLTPSISSSQRGGLPFRSMTTPGQKVPSNMADLFQ